MDDLVAGRYQLVRALGRGGMGEVILARQLNLDRLVVVKRVTDTRSRRNLQALVDEARIAARLNHPNIVSVLDVIEGTEPIVVMEFVPGVTVRDLIENATNGLPPEIAVAIAIDVLRGLGYAHAVRNGDAVGVIHRDVKPRNLMVTFSGVTKLIDFGISRWLDDGGWEATSISGTRGYMAPEQQRGQRVDGRADLYAVGVTLREMLTGVPPIDDTGNADQPPREIREPLLAAIVRRAAADEPDQRFASCTEMIAALETFAAAAGYPVSATVVERWVSSRFADRKAFLEHDAEHKRQRPPTSPTVIDASARARGSRTIQSRIAFAGRNAGPAPDAIFEPVIERLVARHLDHAVERKFEIGASSGAQRIELVFTRSSSGFQIDAVDDDTVLASATASSAWEATAELARSVLELAAKHPTLVTTPHEQRRLTECGTTSWDAYRRYRKAVDMFLETSYPDGRAIAAIVDEVIALDPGWTRAHALLVVLYGITTADAASAFAGGRACPRDRDPRGHRFLDGLEAMRKDDITTACPIFEEVFRADPDDPIIGMMFLRAAVIAQHLDDAAAVARHCFERHPHLLFAVDLAEIYYRTARKAEGELVTRDAAVARPENVPAVVELVRLESNNLRIAEAAHHARNLLAIHGERPEILNELYEALVASEQLQLAQRVAERMLLGSTVERARGRYRMAALAVFEGKFAPAHSSLRRAIDDNRPLGFESELSQCLELGRALAQVTGDPVTARRYAAELQQTYLNVVRDVACAAIVGFEIGLPDGNIDAIVDGLPDGARDLARTRMLRAAAHAGVAPASAAVAQGFTTNEDNTASLLVLGDCACAEGELELARRSYEMAARLWSSVLSNQSSPYHAVLARYHLGGLLAELGDREGARLNYEWFLRRWGNADRPLPEVAAARKALAAL